MQQSWVAESAELMPSPKQTSKTKHTHRQLAEVRGTHLKKAPLNLEDVTLYSTGLMAEFTYTRMRKAYSRLKYTSWVRQREWLSA